MAAPGSDMKDDTTRDDSVDHGDILKGDIVVGAIAGREVQQARAHCRLPFNAY